jgi:monovalent cation/proton antiporter MnhG/PhaG subunit
MIDVLAGGALIVGSLLAALGGIGLLRLPDVLTRMHAATKAATVGVIATTAAAAAESRTWAGGLTLLLVIALLFLTGPVGMSLLARAAYHDPETPKVLATREHATRQPVSAAAPIRHAGGVSPLLAAWLFAVWIVLFGSLRPNVVVGGVVVAGTVALGFRSFSPRWPYAVFHPVATLRFFQRFLIELASSTWQVVWTLRLPRRRLRPAIVAVPLRVQSRAEVVLLMNSISFTPGTVALELHSGNLYIHVLSTHDPGEVVSGVDATQVRILAAFGNVAAEGTTSDHRRS